MQLVSVCLYSTLGELETIEFNPGRLNIVTGVSRTGKSVLVKIIDYCLGRSDIPTSAGNVEKALSWVGALWQLNDGGRAYVGRPLPQGQKKNEQALLIIGDAALQPPTPPLEPNMNTKTMRLVLGQRIGIDESQIDPPPGSLRDPLRTHLGHAAFLCIQNQDEISSSTRIFHRSGERGVDDALRDTIPYFLGAVPPDQALQKALLRHEQRRLQKLERDLRDAIDAVATIDSELLALHTEAIEAGLAEPLDPETPGRSRAELVTLLHRASRDASLVPPDTAPAQSQDAERRARNELELAEDDLYQLLQQRLLLLDEAEGSSDYEDALNIQVGRLTSLDLLPLASEGPSPGPEHNEGAEDTEEPAKPVVAGRCPVCGQESEDPTSGQMRTTLEKLKSQLANIRGASPAKSEALDDINRRIAEVQGRVRRGRLAVDSTFAATSAVGRDANRRQDFTRGRIDAIIARAPEADEGHAALIRERITVAEGTIEELQRQLSDDSARERLTTRLNGVGRDLTKYAQELGLEHSDKNVRIDLAELTVVAEVDDDPVPLHRIGSAENWIGYHVTSHLALHQSFIRHDRPVPRFLVLDQPSQGHYPSEMDRQAETATDADDLAVRKLFRKMYDFVAENDGNFQVITVDHADFEETWFQSSIVKNWRDQSDGPVGLIPAKWIARLDGSTGQGAQDEA
ncbi:DUF3732 domain-containing protein [Jiangella muralis]|uniref:DUF3732 domain-containing protein n=1 Tax=Jiangella muralis TaxID=702383 RepID=UPI00069F1D71|nr:DUF3732 domain-containing protein [Jiangella muralis]